MEDNYRQFRRQLLTIIYNKNTARCAYKNNQKSSAYLFVFAQMNAARCIGEQNQKNNQLSGLSAISVLFNILLSSRPKDGGADADHCTAFFDGDEVVVGHAHGNLFSV